MCNLMLTLLLNFLMLLNLISLDPQVGLPGHLALTVTIDFALKLAQLFIITGICPDICKASILVKPLANLHI